MFTSLNRVLSISIAQLPRLLQIRADGGARLLYTSTHIYNILFLMQKFNVIGCFIV